MELSPGEATSSSATQESPKIFLNLKVRYHFHKSQPMVPVLSQMNPVHTTHSYFSEIDINIIFTPNLCRSTGIFWLSHQNPICSLLSHATFPAHLIRIYLIILIISTEDYKLLRSSLCSFFQPHIISPLFGQDISLSTLVSDTRSLCSSLNITDQVVQPYKATGKIIVSCVLIFTLLTADEKTKGSGLNGSQRYPNLIDS
jgi:hypothetical protein